MRESTSPRRRIPAAERRDLITVAAAGLFAQRGYAGTRLDDIAAAAGVTKPIVYRHFGSKKDLYLALLAKHRDDLPTFLDGVDPAAAGSSPEEAMGRVLEGWFDYIAVNSHSWKMLFRDATGDDEIKAFRSAVSLRAREVLAGFVAAAGASVPADQVEPTAELLTSGLAGLALWAIDHEDVPRTVPVAVATRMCAAALRG